MNDVKQNGVDKSKGIWALSSLSWDFHGVETGSLTHGVHPYPAKYIPQIPSAIIAELSKEGDRVADIFCGSGTTLIEAMVHGRHAIGIDANPLACLISKAKTSRIDDVSFSHLKSLAQRARTLAASIAPNRNTLFPNELFISKAARPDDSDNKFLDFWFEAHVIEELAEILGWCNSLPMRESRDLALVAFSSIIVNVSKQDSDTRYVRREKKSYPGDTLKRYSKVLDEAANRAALFSKSIGQDPTCTIHVADVLTGPSLGPIDLMVCSPPYPNAYSYHLYHRTRMLWLGMDQPEFKKQEIGSHRKYSQKGPGRATAETFRAEMSKILLWLKRHLKPKGYACFVVGNSTLAGKTIDNGTIIADAGEAVGYQTSARFSRRMQDTKKSFNPSLGKIKHEEILILQNMG